MRNQGEFGRGVYVNVLSAMCIQVTSTPGAQDTPSRVSAGRGLGIWGTAAGGKISAVRLVSDSVRPFPNGILRNGGRAKLSSSEGVEASEGTAWMHGGES